MCTRWISLSSLVHLLTLRLQGPTRHDLVVNGTWFVKSTVIQAVDPAATACGKQGKMIVGNQAMGQQGDRSARSSVRKPTILVIRQIPPSDE